MRDANVGLNWERLYRQLEGDLRYILMSAADQMEILESAVREADEISVSTLEVDTEATELSAVCVARGADLEYSFALYGPERFRLVTPYSTRNSHTFSAPFEGVFRVWVYVRSRKDSVGVVIDKSPEVLISYAKSKNEVLS